MTQKHLFYSYTPNERLEVRRLEAEIRRRAGHIAEAEAAARVIRNLRDAEEDRLAAEEEDRRAQNAARRSTARAAREQAARADDEEEEARQISIAIHASLQAAPPTLGLIVDGLASVTLADDPDDQCPICYDDLSGTPCVRGRCNHNLHTRCMEVWVRRCAATGAVPTCVMCRRRWTPA